MSYMNDQAQFALAGGIQELTLDEIGLVDGAAHEAAEAILVGAAAGIFIGSFAGPEGAAVGALVGAAVGYVGYLAK